MEKSDNIYKTYPINRLTDSFYKSGYLDKKETISPFLKINTDRVWIEPDQIEGSIIWVNSNTEWTTSISDDLNNTNNLNLNYYGKTELANSNSRKWIWKW